MIVFSFGRCLGERCCGTFAPAHGNRVSSPPASGGLGGEFSIYNRNAFLRRGEAQIDREPCRNRHGVRQRVKTVFLRRWRRCKAFYWGRARFTDSCSVNEYFCLNSSKTKIPQYFSHVGNTESIPYKKYKYFSILNDIFLATICIHWHCNCQWQHMPSSRRCREIINNFLVRWSLFEERIQQ